MSDAELQVVLAAVITAPDKPARWYAKRLGWEVEQVSRALRILLESGHLARRRVWVYRAGEGG